MKTINQCGFVWAILNPEEAKNEVLQGNEIFALYNDNTAESIEDYGEFKMAKFNNPIFGIEVGNEKELLSDWHESRERNNETRSFESWLEDKAESLIS